MVYVKRGFMGFWRASTRASGRATIVAFAARHTRHPRARRPFARARRIRKSQSKTFLRRRARLIAPKRSTARVTRGIKSRSNARRREGAIPRGDIARIK